MRLSDNEAAVAIRARLEPIGRTALSIVYTEKGNLKSVLKAVGFWLDGEMYDHAAFAEDTSNRFKQTMQYIHDRGIIWGDVSARNILVFDDLHIKLCDFAESSLPGKYPELLFSYEPRYWVPGPDEKAPAKGTLAMELFALGTAICEITEWAVPYGLIEIEELQQKLMDGEYPLVSEINPAREIIQRLWQFEHGSPKEVADTLKLVCLL
ncbi:hypothetical protein S40293_04889 [Stachybotrys chartarum IBT 40293]|nr:hypothetical protein S40293_04889 [Stachybotrys chartarum IBT 40293]